MKRLAALALAAALLAALLAGCAAPAAPAAAAPEAPAAPDASAAPAQGDKTSIVCTIFPLYDWTRQLLGGEAAGVELTLLMQSGVDLHSYQPSVEDMVKIAECDMFIYVGGESDTWVKDALAQAENPDLLAINLLELIENHGGRVETEELVEGMQPEEDHAHAEDTEGEHADEHADEHAQEEEDHAHEEEGHVHAEGEEVPDEHVWLSLKNAEACCNAIYEGLCALPGAGEASAEAYQANLAAYMEKLDALDAQYAAAVDAAPVKTLLFGDRFPFRYLMDDYGIGYFAAFPGCSAETEASFETVAFLTGKVDELALKNVMVTESADQSIAGTIIENTVQKNQRILVLNAMQSLTSAQIDSGVTYLSLMEDNLKVLQEALQ